MERAEWLKQMRKHVEGLYDIFAPAYWVTFGFYPNTTHCRFIENFLARLIPPADILDAACGAGRYDEMLVPAGHRVLGIDQSTRMLARAREHYPVDQFPRLRYERIGLQEIDFREEFDGAICVDAMEHVCPEDWPGILARFQKALRPGGLLYLTVEVPDWNEVRECYEQASARGLPVVFGEVVDELDAASLEGAGLDPAAIPAGRADNAVYHYHPALEQARAWTEQAGLAIEEEGTGDGYAHFLLQKKR